MAYEFINDTGVIVADTSDTQAEIEAEYLATFGTDLDLAPETPQGILISAETTSRTGIATNNAQLANQINPNIAGGVFLDALYALMGGERQQPAPTTFSIEVLLNGVPDTIIPIGSLAATAAGDEFVSTTEGLINFVGIGGAEFESVEVGPIPCALNALDIIVTPVEGWTAIDNLVAGTLGNLGQSDVSTRAERNLALGLQGSGLSASIFANVLVVFGVTSVLFVENIANTVETVDDVVDMDPHSIWVCVDGGSDLDVATALLASKNAGAQWNNGKAGGAVSEDVTDPLSGQVYTVLFDRPTLVPVKFEITIASTNISNAQTIVKNAVLAYADGELDGQEGFLIGVDASPFEASGAVNIVEPGIVVTLAQAAKTADSFLPATVAIESTERATLLASNITVIIL